MKTKILLLLIVLFVWFVDVNISAQNTFVLKDTKAFTKTKKEHTITNVIVNEENGKIVRLFCNESGIDTIDGGSFLGMVTGRFETGLLFENGKTIVLTKNELFIKAYQNSIVTRTNMWSNNSCELRFYRLTDSGVRLLGEIRIPMEHNVYIANNGNFIVLDESEGYGKCFKVYSSEMKLLDAHIPFIKSGFSQSAFCDNGNTILLIFKPDQIDEKKNNSNSNSNSNSNIQKLMLVDINTGEIKLEKDLIINENYSVNMLKVYNDIFIVYCSTYLLALDISGNVLWKRNVVLPNFFLEGNEKQNCIYACTNDSILCIDLYNGKTIWSKSFSSIYNLPLISKPLDYFNITCRPIEMNLINNGEYVGLLYGQFQRGTLFPKLNKYNMILYVFDKKGNIRLKSKTLETTKSIKIISCKNNLRVINDNSIMIYERK